MAGPSGLERLQKVPQGHQFVSERLQLPALRAREALAFDGLFHHRPAAAFPQQPLDSLDGVALGLEQVANVAQQLHILGPVIAPAATALERPHLREFRLPKAQNVLRDV